VGINLVFGLIYLFTPGAELFGIENIASIMGVFAARLCFNMVRGRIMNRWVQ
jgi:hypothetical protein